MVNTREEKVLAGGFPHVRVYMTENSEIVLSRYRWVDTQLIGTLKLTVIGEIEQTPLATIKILSSDDQLNEGEPIFEYEVPLNFKHECDLSHIFYTIKSPKEHYFGFLFENPCDKEAFCAKMKKLNNVMRKSKREIVELRR